jgi:hypothetical protein
LKTWRAVRSDSLCLLLPLVLLPLLPTVVTLYRHVLTQATLLVALAGVGMIPVFAELKRRTRRVTKLTDNADVCRVENMFHGDRALFSTD